MFASHSTTVPRNRRVIDFLKHRFDVIVPFGANGRIIGANFGTVFKMALIGGTSFYARAPAHFDVIDLFSYPIFYSKGYLLDVRCPVPIELRWLGFNRLAALAEKILGRLVNSAAVIIGANKPMLDYSQRFGHTSRKYIIPNCPSKETHRKLRTHDARDLLNLDHSMDMALFVTSGRLKEIYGFDLLLASWKHVHRYHPDARLYIVGPTGQIKPNLEFREKLLEAGIQLVGRVAHSQISKWISAADVCLSQRTPGFPSRYYNHQDSLKISEYAALEKPIVAAGYSESDQYLSSLRKPIAYAEAIRKAMAGDVPLPVPRFWEDNIPLLEEAYNELMCSLDVNDD